MGTVKTKMSNIETELKRIFEFIQGKNLSNSSQNVESDKKSDEDLSSGAIDK